MKEKVKLAYLIEKFPSPTEYFILNEILALEKQGVQLYVLVIRKQKNYLSIPEVEQVRSKILYLPKILLALPFLGMLFSIRSLLQSSSLYKHPPSIKSWVKKLRNISWASYFYWKLRHKNVTHVHAHFAFVATDIASIFPKIGSISYSFTAHAQDIYTNPENIVENIENAKFAVTCTQYNKNHINEITHNTYIEKVYHVYHGIANKNWQIAIEPSVKTINILSVARLVEKKGLQYLIRAVKELIKKGFDVKCTLIGEGPLLKTLQELIQVNSLEQSIAIIPFITQNKLKHHYKQADVFILPCIIAENGDRDGLPNVILEAMLSRVPVISTPVSAIPEIIVPNKTGILVREKEPNDIAEAVQKLIEDKVYATKITKMAIDHVKKNFDLENCTSNLIKIYRQHLL